jgi:TolA-binding protein
MSNAPQRDTKAAISEAVQNFITRYRIPILVVLGIVVVVVVSLFVYFEIRDNRASAAADQLATLEETYSAWQQAGEDARPQLEEEFISGVESLTSRYGTFYAAARARFLRGNLHWQQEEWTVAAEWYTAVANEHEESHLATVALYNAAAAHEEAGGVPAAIETLTRLVSSYSEEDAAEVPRALFSLGRLHESQESWSEAAEYYRRLTDDYGASNWTNFARDRIIWLTSEGLIEEAS